MVIDTGVYDFCSHPLIGHESHPSYFARFLLVQIPLGWWLGVCFLFPSLPTAVRKWGPVGIAGVAMGPPTEAKASHTCTAEQRHCDRCATGHGCDGVFKEDCPASFRR